MALPKLCEYMKATAAAMSVVVAVSGTAQVRSESRYPSGAPSTTNNDDSCDISAMPAATLLLPYFEVSATAPSTTSRDTKFSVTNVSPVPAIANVVVWTDRGFPVFGFPLYLTGYDAQSVSLRGVLMLGELPSTSSSSARGSLALPNDANPNFDANAMTTCAAMPASLPPSFAEEVRDALTVGTFFAASGIGSVHPERAIGYITIDVVSSCSVASPTDAAYYANDLLYDNVLTGEYVIDDLDESYSMAGDSMVHIRAVPEGGAAGASVPTNLPYTFYDRLSRSHAVSSDRRQPLPSTFAARWIHAGTGSFQTSQIMWREPYTGANAATASYANNAVLPIENVLRFDEEENVEAFAPCETQVCPVAATNVADKISLGDSNVFPPMSNGSIAGWIYLDLHNGGSPSYSPPPSGYGSSRPSQNWVVLVFDAEGRYSTQASAPALGNGCTPVNSSGVIGPAPNVTP
jgi:hypothetical protein